MPLSEITKRGVVRALSSNFDASEVSSLLEALDVLQNTSPPLRAASPNMGMYISGRYYDSTFGALTSPPPYTGIAGRIDLIPFFTTQDLIVNEFSIGVLTGVASTNARILIYGSDINYQPSSKLYESPDLSTATSTTVPAHTQLFRFEANRMYWIGVQCSGAPSLRGVRDYTLPSLGLVSNAASAGNTATIGRTVTYGAAPASWGFLESDLSATLAPSVRFKVA